jgi:DNA-binding response OmpR family regulator
MKLLKTLRSVLKEPEYRLITCADPHSAVLFLKSKIPYQLLLIDFNWREAKDWKLAQIATRLRHRRKMTKILLTRRELTGRQKARAQEAGISEWMMKTEDVGGMIEAKLK